jgi:hypothetical protein
MSEKSLGQFTKNYSASLSFQKFGFGIRDPEKPYFGSGFATLT